MELERAGTTPETIILEQGLKSNRKFLQLWISSMVIGVSFSIYMLIETWYVVDKLNLSSMLGMILMATTLPRIFLMIFGGVMVDRFNPSTIMSLSAGLRGFLMACLIIALYFDVLSIWVLFVFALFFGILDAFYWPANGSVLPSIVGKNQLTRANSIIQTTSNITFIIGPVIAGWLLGKSSYMFLFGFTGLLLMVGALIVFTVNNKGTKTRKSGSAWSSLKEGLIYVKNSPLLLSSMMIGIIVNLCLAGPGNMAGPIIVKDILNGNSQDLSFIESAIAIGMVLGGLVIGIWNPTRKRGILSLSRLIALGCVFIFYSQVNSLWHCIVVSMVIGFLITAGDIPMRSLNQEKTDPDKMGRVSGINSTISQGLVPLSFALTSIGLSLNISILTLLLVCGITLILYSCFGFWKFEALRKAD